MEYAVAAEQAGFILIDVSDHFAPWSEEGQACFVRTWLGAVAVQTKTIRLGPGVTSPILRYHPAIIAQAAATLSHFAPGRTYLGLGTGEALNEYSSGNGPDMINARICSEKPLIWSASYGKVARSHLKGNIIKRTKHVYIHRQWITVQFTFPVRVQTVQSFLGNTEMGS